VGLVGRDRQFRGFDAIGPKRSAGQPEETPETEPEHREEPDTSAEAVDEDGST
jgi:hypothetical protein